MRKTWSRMMMLKKKWLLACPEMMCCISPEQMEKEYSISAAITPLRFTRNMKWLACTCMCVCVCVCVCVLLSLEFWERWSDRKFDVMNVVLVAGGWALDWLCCLVSYTHQPCLVSLHALTTMLHTHWCKLNTVYNPCCENGLRHAPVLVHETDCIWPGW